uniref:Uncharacterized protein n=1 Tax=Xenopus tropicalis TaxID=8364 RepID=A0A1B8Y3J6_XENTR
MIYIYLPGADSLGSPLISQQQKAGANERAPMSCWGGGGLYVRMVTDKREGHRVNTQRACP